MRNAFKFIGIFILGFTLTTQAQYVVYTPTEVAPRKGEGVQTLSSKTLYGFLNGLFNLSVSNNSSAPLFTTNAMVDATTFYSITVTVTNSVITYTNGECYGPLIQLTNVARSGISPVLAGISIVKTNGLTPFFNFLIFSENPTNGTYTDGNLVMALVDWPFTTIAMSDYTNYHTWHANGVATYFSLLDAPTLIRGTNTIRYIQPVVEGASFTETTTNSTYITFDWMK